MLVLNVSDAGRAAEFLGRAVGYVRQQDAPDFLIPPNGEGLQLHLGEKDRTHLDLWVDRQLSDLEAEVDRLVALGATRVDWAIPLTQTSWSSPTLRAICSASSTESRTHAPARPSVRPRGSRQISALRSVEGPWHTSGNATC